MGRQENREEVEGSKVMKDSDGWWEGMRDSKKLESESLEMQRRRRWRASEKRRKWHEGNRKVNDGMEGCTA